MKYLLITVLTITSASSFAASKKCSELQSCIELASKLTNKKYIMDRDVKGKINFTENFKITKENADSFISHALYMAGYTRVPFNKNEWSIINARDVRYQAVPSYQYGKDTIPETFDYISTTIKLKNPHIASELSRNFRPFMSRYGRTIDLKSPGVISINDTGKNVHRLIKLVYQIDHKPREDELEKIEEDKKRWNKLNLIKAKNCTHTKEELKEVKHLLFELKHKK